MALSESQRAANARYRAAGKRGQINISTTRDVLEDIAAYAATRGMRPAECARDCLRRCMIADGWRIGATQPAQLAAHQGAAIPGEPQPPKRKRGRPRKNPSD